MGIEATEKSMEEMLGSPVDISSLKSDGISISELAFNLYRETAIVTILVSHLYESTHAEDAVLQRNQAIEAGLAIRIAKYMGAVLALLVDRVREHGEVIMTLNRCITESAINLRFFCEKASTNDYCEFVRSSLKPEREQYKIILKNIAERGEKLPIETRMLNSIERIFKVSGVGSIAELDRIQKRKRYGKILEALDMSDAYPMLQGVPSHAVHGTWVDLVAHHLEEVGSGFRPKSSAMRADARLLLPISIFVLDAMQSYVGSRFPALHPGMAVLSSRIEDLMRRLKEVDSCHENEILRRRDS